MKKTELRVCCEMGVVARETLTTRAQNEDAGKSFIDFLRYCAEQIDKGDSVQAVWRGYQMKGL